MRPLWKDIVSALMMGAVLPGLMLNFGVMALDQEQETAMPVETTQAQTVPPIILHPVSVLTEDGEELWDMDQYLTCVLLGEIPASFELEAMKAQSVAARTYARKAQNTGGKHGNGSICTKSGCCQAFLEVEEYLANGGTQEGVDKIRRAVTATSGMCLTYEGELIEATYFSSSGGYTEDAQAVWGSEYPYLQAVSSPGEEHSTHFRDTKIFTSEQFCAALGEPLEGKPESWFGAVTYTDGGGVDTMTIGSRSYTGTQLRSLLGLRSTAFSVLTGEDRVTITTRGYGHRVGLSQYGADAMAAGGSTYHEILAHYYPGTTLTYWE